MGRAHQHPLAVALAGPAAHCALVWAICFVLSSCTAATNESAAMLQAADSARTPWNTTGWGFVNIYVEDGNRALVPKWVQVVKPVSAVAIGCGYTSSPNSHWFIEATLDTQAHNPEQQWLVVPVRDEIQIWHKVGKKVVQVSWSTCNIPDGIMRLNDPSDDGAAKYKLRDTKRGFSLETTQEKTGGTGSQWWAIASSSGTDWGPYDLLNRHKDRGYFKFVSVDNDPAIPALPEQPTNNHTGDAMPWRPNKSVGYADADSIPAKMEMYLVRSAVVPSMLVYDSRYQNPVDKAEGCPYYLFQRWQYWQKTTDFNGSPGEEKTWTLEEFHSDTKTEEFKKTTGWSVEAQGGLTYNGAEARVTAKYSNELTTTSTFTEVGSKRQGYNFKWTNTKKVSARYMVYQIFELTNVTCLHDGYLVASWEGPAPGIDHTKIQRTITLYDESLAKADDTTNTDHTSSNTTNPTSGTIRNDARMLLATLAVCSVQLFFLLF